MELETVGVAPYARLLGLIQESLANAGITATVQGAALTALGCEFRCNRLGLKTKVRFLDRDYTFTRYACEPSVEVAVQDVIRDLGKRLEGRRLRMERERRLQEQRAAAEQARLAETELRALKAARKATWIAQLAELQKFNAATKLSDDVFQVGDARVVVTEEGMEVRFSTTDYLKVAMLADFIASGGDS